MNIKQLTNKTYFLITIFTVAAIVRFNHINQPFVDVFSWRQASTAMMADNFYRINWNIFYPEVSWGGIGPNYQGREFQTVSYIAALLYRLVGQQDWVGRSVAVVFGLWGIFALYQLVRRVWDEKRAIAAAMVMAILPGSIFIERSFLPDPAMVALVTTSLWLLVVYLQTERWHFLFWAGAIGMWGFLSKITGLIIGIPMLYATATILYRQRMLYPRKLITIGVGGVLMLTPVIAYYLWARHLSLSYPPYHFAGSGNWLWSDGLNKWLSQKYFLPQLVDNFTYWLWTWPTIILVGLGLFCRPPGTLDNQEDLPRLETQTQAPWLFHWWFVASLIYYVIGAKELVHNPWNFQIMNPVAAALAGHGLVSITSVQTRVVRWIPFVIAGTFILIIGLLGHTNLKAMYSRPYGEESYHLGLRLRHYSQPGELVVTMASDLGDPNALYYSQRRGWTFPPASNEIDWSKFPEDDSDSIRMFESLQKMGADWLGVANERKKDFWVDHPRLVKYIQNNCRFVEKNKYGVIYQIVNQ